jgi:hypothetical protein
MGIGGDWHAAFEVMLLLMERFDHLGVNFYFTMVPS